MHRRQLIKVLPGLALAGTAPVALAAQRPCTEASRPLNILILGGTNFVGPEIVRAALRHGHRVTLFNRGVSHPWLFSTQERLVGNRYPNQDTGLAALEGTRQWDAVIDTWQQSPLCVRESARLLRERAGHYVYLSSIAVYGGANYRKAEFDESAPLPQDDLPTSWEETPSYPAAKRLSEAAVADAFGERHTLLRAYGISGPDARGRLDIDGQMTGVHGAYWPIRMRRGGTVLAPGDGQDRVQWIDVRDLADFAVQACEQRLAGPYNVGQAATWKDFLGRLGRAFGSKYNLEWVPAEFLFGQGVASFTDVPMWVSRHESEPGFYYADNRRALQAGLAPGDSARAFGPTTDAFLRFHADFNFIDPVHGVDIARRESELLDAWAAFRVSKASASPVEVTT